MNVAIGMVIERWVIDVFNVGMGSEEFRNSQRG